MHKRQLKHPIPSLSVPSAAAIGDPNEELDWDN